MGAPKGWLDQWQQQDLTAESRTRLQELLDAQRSRPVDHADRDRLLDAFLTTLTESQLVVFARLLREMTEQVH